MALKPVLEFENFEYFYNLTSKKVAFITMDVDWASDEVLHWTYDWFFRNEIPITAFATHPSSILTKYSGNSLAEVAIHPNFSNSLEPDYKIKELVNYYPQSIGSRSHRNIIGRNFTDALHKFNLKYDSSKLLWRARNLEVYPLYNGMIDIPYIWEDGVHLELNESSTVDATVFNHQGLKILNIHPVLFFLNHRSYTQLKSFTSKYSDLTQVPFSSFVKAKYEGEGIGTFSQQLFLALKNEGYNFHLLRDIALEASAYLNSRNNSNTFRD